jgi:integrase/recombinase XerD
MKRRKIKRPLKQPIGDPKDPKGMIALMEQFFEWLRMRNYAEWTVRTRRSDLIRFINWCAARGIAQPTEVTKPIIERFQRFLFHFRRPNGSPLSFQTQNGAIVSVRAWFKWLARSSHILYNPAADIEFNRTEHRLPKCVLTVSEAEQVINQTDISTRLGIRDRAILETFYSTGMRRTELMTLRPCDIDMERGTVVIRLGKGKKDRMIPIGDRALAWIDRYVVEVRPGLLVGDSAGDVLFLTHLGEPFAPDQMSLLVGNYVAAAGIGKEGSCHLFRHTMATVMLENGAGIRYIQAMLGHAKLETTQIYTRVSIRRLKEVHTNTHPARKDRSP